MKDENIGRMGAFPGGQWLDSTLPKESGLIPGQGTGISRMPQLRPGPAKYTHTYKHKREQGD